MISKLWRRVQLMIGVAAIKSGADDGNVQLLQAVLSALETRDKVPRLGEYGLASMPPADSDAVLVFLGGDRSNGVIIATGHQASRLKNLAPGESALYDDLGRKIHLTRGGIVVDAANGPITVNNATVVTINAATKVELNTPLLKVNGDITATGTITGTTDVIGGGKSLKTHTHGGVTTGSGTTGPPS